MHVAGGLYRELCCIPDWQALYGSGGRAAAAVSRISPESVLHTFADESSSRDAGFLRRMGVELQITSRSHPIAFAYFHPLSRPIMEPTRSETPEALLLHVSGEVALRFGFVEGDAVVQSRYAIYDPQTWRNPRPFAENGSTTTNLAVVLNRAEALALAGKDDLKEAAETILKRDKAAVVVAKDGAAGAYVFEPGGMTSHVPAYRSSRVFKIGTGDVYCAMFSHFWAEKLMPAVNAADLASRCVAEYCESGFVPISIANLEKKQSVASTARIVCLLGSASTLGRRYTMEEASYALKELGVKVICPSIDKEFPTGVDAFLIVKDGFEAELGAQLNFARRAGTPVTILDETADEPLSDAEENSLVTTTSDFSTALYLAVWATSKSHTN